MTSWTNYDDALGQLRAAGLEVEALQVGTHKPVRCREVGGGKEKRCWYWLSDIELTDKKGDRALFITGAFGIYRGAENLKGKIQLRKSRVEITADERLAMEARHRETVKRNKAFRDAEIKKAAARAQHAWSRYVRDGESPYLAEKRVKPHGLRFSPTGNGTVAVPMMDAAGRIWGLQIIRSSERRRGLQKEYWPKGLDKVGHYHVLGAPQAGGVVLLCEGYATGATLHESAGLPVAVAFDAGNLLSVGRALRAAYPGIRIMVCADDDFVQRCRECHKHTPVEPAECAHCGAEHGQKNPGIEVAKAAAHGVSGAWVAPQWPIERDWRKDRKVNDFNDLATHADGGPHLCRAQISAALREAGWSAPVAAVAGDGQARGAGESDRPGAVSIMSVDNAVERYLPIDDGTGKVLFDTWTQRMVLREQMVTLLPAGIRWDDVKRHPTWIARGSYYLDEVGFDPPGTDSKTRLNTWTGWPTVPAEGDCRKALDLLRYLCSGEPNGDETYRWIMRWLAYPIQNPGAKMRSALVVHGPQGTGKSMFFEAIADIYGDYGILLNQGAIEDKFNSDWSSRKLFVLADEIVARQEMHHIKNQLKGFITGDWIRVNPKNLPAYRERNHMNIVFLSNERQPVVLENDDRRHCVVWTPPALSDAVYEQLTQELESGGLAALHHHLLHLDLTGFHPWTKPPMTGAKADLQDLGRSSVERFVQEWQALDIENKDGDGVMPFCPCQGSHLYVVFRRWCERTGERDNGDKRLIGHVKKIHGWTAAQSEPTWRSFADRITTNRKMVVPCKADMTAAVDHCTTGEQEKLHPDAYATKKDWLTASFFAFKAAGGFE